MTPKYTVIRDTREQENHGWIFPAAGRCEGTFDETLKTGDYTLRGYEKQFIVERKGSSAEFVKNLVEKRFERELVRLDSFAHAFIVLEFEMTQIIKYPEGSGIPEHLWPELRMTPQAIMQKLNELQLRHKARVVFAGKYGREFASSLFKRITDNVQISS